MYIPPHIGGMRIYKTVAIVHLHYRNMAIWFCGLYIYFHWQISSYLIGLKCSQDPNKVPEIIWNRNLEEK
jgi:hypothetical protein